MRDDCVAEALVRAFERVVLKKLANRPVEGSLAKHDHSIEALLLDRADEPLGVGVAVRRKPLVNMP